MGETRITLSSSYVGTPLYAAPEQLRDSASADARSDVWSLGVVLFEMLTGRTPFRAELLEVIARVMVDPVPWACDLRADIPRELAHVLLRAMDRDPGRRLQSMSDLSDALASFGPAESAADTVANLRRGRGRLGEILVADGLLAEGDLDVALAEQGHCGPDAGPRILLDLGLVAQADLLAALAKQQGIGDDAPERAPDPAPPAHSAPPSPRWPWQRIGSKGAYWLALAAVVWIGSLLAVAAAR